MSSQWFYWDKDTQTFKEGFPPDPFPKYGQAPLVSMGNLTPQRHPATGQVIDNVKAWDLADKMSGTYTTTTREITKKRERPQEEVDKEWVNGIDKAIADLENGRHPLSPTYKEKKRRGTDDLNAPSKADAIKSLTGVDVKREAKKKAA